MGRSVGHGIREFKDSLSGNDKPDEPEELTPAATAAASSAEASDDEATSSPAPERVTN
jgi:Sec-independent protein translocase protein TatA